LWRTKSTVLHSDHERRHACVTPPLRLPELPRDTVRTYEIERDYDNAINQASSGASVGTLARDIFVSKPRRVSKGERSNRGGLQRVSTARTLSAEVP
jgi:hypothetical protein